MGNEHQLPGNGTSNRGIEPATPIARMYTLYNKRKQLSRCHFVPTSGNKAVMRCPILLLAPLVYGWSTLRSARGTGRVGPGGEAAGAWDELCGAVLAVAVPVVERDAVAPRVVQA